MKRKHKKLLAAAAVSGLSATAVHAGAIAPGDLVVYQVGAAGVANAATSGSSPLLIQDLNPSLTNQTVAVQTFNISTMSNPLYTTNEGSTGQLTLADNNTEVAFTGWTYGGDATNLSSDTTNTTRGVGTIDFNGNYGLPATATPTTLTSAGDQTRSAYSADGNAFYMGDKGGLYINNGTAPIGGAPNTRALHAYNGVLYAGVQSTASVVQLVTPSAPTLSTTSATYSNLPGLPADSSGVDFAMVASGANGPGVLDTIYTTEGNTHIDKYGLVSGSWVLEGTTQITLPSGTKTTNLFAVESAGDVDIYYDSDPSTGLSTVDEVVDTAGYNAQAALAASTPTLLYSAPSGDILRGISAAPVPEPTTLGVLVLGGATLGLRRKRRPEGKKTSL